MIQRLYASPDIAVGLVIGTYAAVPYVHLQLESYRRLCPGAACLVHDDASPEKDRLTDLCARYGADFVPGTARRRHTCGDLAAFVAGLEWADELGLDIVLKLSRRFVPVLPWRASLSGAAWESQQATLSNRCDYHGFGFRTECAALAVRPWMGAGIAMLRAHRDAGEHCFVENLVHQAACVVQEKAPCAAGAVWRLLHPAHPGCGGYAPWELMGTARVHRQRGYLWHEAALPADYARRARAWGMDYPAAAWEDPNASMGEAHH